MPSHQNSEIHAKKANKNEQLEHEFSEKEINFIRPEPLNIHLSFYTEIHTHMQREWKEIY